MGIELILGVFNEDDDKRNDAPILERLADVVREALRQLECEEDGSVETSDEVVFVDLPGGTAEIRANCATFPIQTLDPLTLRVVFEVAKAGDMVIITEGGDYSAIVIDSKQRVHFSDEEWQSEDVTPLCESPKELKHQLSSWYRVHSEFTRAVVEDWRAKDPSSPSWDVQIRFSSWDPWLDKNSDNAPQPEPVMLHRFDAMTNRKPKHPDVLRELTELCRQHLQTKSEPSSSLIDDDGWPDLTLLMQFFSAEIWPWRVDFLLYELTDAVAESMFNIARAGDMSFILPGSIILTDSGQEVQLPQRWKLTRKIACCDSAIELKSLLRYLQFDIPMNVRKDECAGLPAGAYPFKRVVLYIEVKVGETPVEHQKKVYKHKVKGPESPDRSGLMMAESWQLETPAGQRFYAYGYGGVGWMEFLLDFARSEGRAIGEIVNFETFVQDDGQRFSLSECRAQKVDA
jgi:hypothetical protein